MKILGTCFPHHRWGPWQAQPVRYRQAKLDEVLGREPYVVQTVAVVRRCRDCDRREMR